MIKVIHKPSRLIGAIFIFWLLNGAIISNVSATTINFDYSGSSLITGSGSFSFTNGLSQVGLADLSAFSLTLTFDNGDSVKPSFSFSLSDLTAFNAALDQNLLLTSLSLSTNNVFSIPQTNSAGVFFAPQSFHVTAIDTTGGAFTTFNGFDMSSTGIVTQSTSATVPEPSTLSLLNLVMLSFFFRKAKRNGLM